MLLLDLYCFQVVRTLSQPAGSRTRTVLFLLYWGLSVTAVLLILLLPYLRSERISPLFRSTLFSVVAGLFFAKLVGALFFLTDDLRRGLQWLGMKAIPAYREGSGEPIPRSLFLSWAGTLVGGGLFGTLIYGLSNKYRFQVRRVRLHYPDLPRGFSGLRIVQLSDIHAGSFTDPDGVCRGIRAVLDERPDLVVFTGDLVNNLASEMEPYRSLFAEIRAPLGVYSILGNHDYGDYVAWDSPREKQENLERLKQVHRELGWRLLLNEHVVLERGGDRIAILGVENWSSKARFPKYGDLSKAYDGSGPFPFKILLSHDPSHWKGEVLPQYPDIALVLSGHTHGMQFGVEIPGLKWSPVQYVYREWAGLYEDTSRPGAVQRLYVNRGFGFLGYPGRVGILPEITVIELAGES
jgi:predicted MPP superfamily phosphohydrolase